MGSKGCRILVLQGILAWEFRVERDRDRERETERVIPKPFSRIRALGLSDLEPFLGAGLSASWLCSCPFLCGVSWAL